MPTAIFMDEIVPEPTPESRGPRQPGDGCLSVEYGSIQRFTPGTTVPDGCHREHVEGLIDGQYNYCCPDPARRAAVMDELASGNTRIGWATDTLKQNVRMWLSPFRPQGTGQHSGFAGLTYIFLGAYLGAGAIAGAVGAPPDNRLRGSLWGAAGAAGLSIVSKPLLILLFGSPYHIPELPRPETPAFQWLYMLGPSAAAGYFAGKKGTES